MPRNETTLEDTRLDQGEVGQGTANVGSASEALGIVVSSELATHPLRRQPLAWDFTCASHGTSVYAHYERRASPLFERGTALDQAVNAALSAECSADPSGDMISQTIHQPYVIASPAVIEQAHRVLGTDPAEFTKAITASIDAAACHDRRGAEFSRSHHPQGHLPTNDQVRFKSGHGYGQGAAEDAVISAALAADDGPLHYAALTMERLGDAGLIQPHREQETKDFTARMLAPMLIGVEKWGDTSRLEISWEVMNELDVRHLLTKGARAHVTPVIEGVLDMPIEEVRDRLGIRSTAVSASARVEFRTGVLSQAQALGPGVPSVSKGPVPTTPDVHHRGRGWSAGNER